MIYGVEGKEIIEVPKGLFQAAGEIAQRIIAVADWGANSGLMKMREQGVGEPSGEWSLLVVRAETLRDGQVALDSLLTASDPDAEIVEEPVGSGRFQVALNERYKGPTAQIVREALTRVA